MEGNDSMMKVFALIGFLTVLVLVIYVIKKGTKSKDDKNEAPKYPPNDYMRQTGMICPDYWSYVGMSPDGKSYRCKNVFNIPTSDDDNKCYDNPDNKIKNFSVINEWPISNIPEGNVDEVLDTRCKWISKCGPSPNSDASWIGINDKCKM